MQWRLMFASIYIRIWYIDYKNSILDGFVFQLGARLVLYTGNTIYSTYVENI